MVNDDDILEKDDMYILDKIREFCVQAESTASVAAAKQLGVLIDRVVCQNKALHGYKLTFGFSNEVGTIRRP